MVVNSDSIAVASLVGSCAAVSEFVAEVAGPHEISSLLHTTGGSKVVIVVKEVPDSLTIPDSVETDPSLLVTSHVVVNSVVTSAATLDEVGGGNVVIVVNDVPDSLTIPDSVETDPSLLVTSQVVVNSVVISDEVTEIAESVGVADATLD